ncbi:unnamed protein product [Cunninghamella echinulata]
MTKSLLLISILLFYHTLYILCDPQGRINPGCSLIHSTIYCFGGFKRINTEFYYTNAINEHISLDLTAIIDYPFKILNTSNIQWKNVSNRLHQKRLQKLGNIATVDLTDNTYLLFGGSIYSKSRLSLENFIPSSFSLIQYHPQNDSWNNRSLYKINNNKVIFYNVRPDLVNFGNNKVWLWGNSAYNSDSSLFYLYNYQTSTWFYQGISDQPIRYGHSTVFAKKNGLIYILGGYSLKEYPSTSSSLDFYSILTFNTTSLDWSTLNSKGDIPTNRGSHTAIESSDQNYLLIYGGSLISNNKVLVTQDVYYVYDIFNNTFTKVSLSLGESNQINISRFGHYATLYQTNYLILAFGFQDENKPSDSINVINVTNPFYPIWLPTSIQIPLLSPSILSTPTSTNTNSDEKGIFAGDTLKKAVISISVIAVIIAFSGIFLFIRHKKRKQKFVPGIVQEEELRMIDYHFTTIGNKSSLSQDEEGERMKTYIPAVITKNNHRQGGRMELDSS